MRNYTGYSGGLAALESKPFVYFVVTKVLALFQLRFLLLKLVPFAPVSIPFQSGVPESVPSKQTIVPSVFAI